MKKVPYPKHLISFEEQISLLKKRGLIIPNEEKALHLLRNISYYRLSGYWVPLLSDKSNHIFKSGATFDLAFNIYKFDAELRRLVMLELEKIEVAVCTQFVYIFSQEEDNYWFANRGNFVDCVKHQKILNKLTEEYNRSDEEFIIAFKKKYSDDFPPGWMMMEITSFGSLSLLYSNLRPGRKKRQVAAYFGLSDVVLMSWLHTIVYIRNVCAHHCCLWNRKLRIRPLIPKSPKRSFISTSFMETDHIYFVLCMIVYLLDVVNPNHTFIQQLQLLLMKYPQIDRQAMKFPRNWEKIDFWKR